MGFKISECIAITLPGVLEARTLIVPNNAFNREDFPTLGWPKFQGPNREERC
jgi:hypothetical protein